MKPVFADSVIIADAMFRSVSRDEAPAPGGVAISGKYIACVGSPREVEEWIGPDTKVYRYGPDALLIPAICDAHLHLSWTIFAENGPALRYVLSEEQCVANVKTWRAKHPDAPWVLGTGFHQANWPGKQLPTKKLLSEAVPDVPVLLMDIDMHGGWVNQKALDVLGITKDTPNPEGGIIYRDEQGEPSGYLEETAALNSWAIAMDAFTQDPDSSADQCRSAIASLNRRGVTTIHDALDTPEAWYRTLVKLRDDGDLNLRVSTSVCVNDSDDFLADGFELAKTFPDKNERIYFWGFKALIDGVGGVHSAWMTEPYADRPDSCGYPLMNPDTMKERILACEKAGYGVHMHTCGTRAVEFALDCVEAARESGYVHSQRNTITHCDAMNAKDFIRFKELDVVAALQPDMLTPTPSYADNFYPEFFGERLMATCWATRTMFDNARIVSFSSDAPVGVAGSMDEIFRATQRVHNDGTPAGGIHPEQKISIAESLWAFTYGGAYQLGREDMLGTLEARKFADIAVLDHNLFTCEPREIQETAALLTMIDGEVVYEA
jgi:predicted amidohydrolase YtcJ